MFWATDVRVIENGDAVRRDINDLSTVLFGEVSYGLIRQTLRNRDRRLMFSKLSSRAHPTVCLFLPIARG